MTTKVLHRLKQARSLVTRAEMVLTGAQILLALGPVGVAVGLVLWIRHRRAQQRREPGAETRRTEPDEQVPIPAPATSATTAPD